MWEITAISKSTFSLLNFVNNLSMSFICVLEQSPFFINWPALEQALEDVSTVLVVTSDVHLHVSVYITTKIVIRGQGFSKYLVYWSSSIGEAAFIFYLLFLGQVPFGSALCCLKWPAIHQISLGMLNQFWT